MGSWVGWVGGWVGGWVDLTCVGEARAELLEIIERAVQNGRSQVGGGGGGGG